MSHVNRRSLWFFIVHINEVKVRISTIRYTKGPEDCYIVASSLGPDEMSHIAPFHLGLHSCKNTY